jgi:hypothetical protein
VDDDTFYPGVVPKPETRVSEFEAGPSRLIVVYEPPDTGGELDARVIFKGIAADAARRSAAGLTLQSIAVLPLRRAGLVAGLSGSGVESKAAIVVVYERR